MVPVHQSADRIVVEDVSRVVDLVPYLLELAVGVVVVFQIHDVLLGIADPDYPEQASRPLMLDPRLRYAIAERDGRECSRCIGVILLPIGAPGMRVRYADQRTVIPIVEFNRRRWPHRGAAWIDERRWTPGRVVVDNKAVRLSADLPYLLTDAG